MPERIVCSTLIFSERHITVLLFLGTLANALALRLGAILSKGITNKKCKSVKNMVLYRPWHLFMVWELKQEVTVPPHWWYENWNKKSEFPACSTSAGNVLVLNFLTYFGILKCFMSSLFFFLKKRSPHCFSAESASDPWRLLLFRAVPLVDFFLLGRHLHFWSQENLFSYIYVYIYIHRYRYVCIHVYMYVCIYIVYNFSYMCIYEYRYEYMHMYI